ncbi:MAG: hypothetical protein OEU91_07480 [Gammaproteobacteria bacterium]|nr:hypothetical protein [Gammaproteobacteria bacterium]
MFRKSVVVATFLVLASPRLSALGLGEIDMQSALNQPMQAVITLTSAAKTDLGDVEVSLASLQAHQRAGLSKAALLADFHFTVERDTTGRAVVRITGSEAVQEPYLEFLLELEWPKGRLLREYTVLVDPPVTMPAIPAVPQAPVTRAATPQPARQISPPPATTSTATAPAVVPVASVTANEYGPIRRSDTLWSIAERTRPGADVSMHQMMQALLRANPDAFINNNINNMKAGATLKLPGRDDILSMSAREALAESRRQYSDWEAANTAVAIPEPVAPVESPAAASADAAPSTDAVQEAVQPPAADTQIAESRLSLVVPEEGSIAGAAAPGETVDAEVEPGSVADLNMQLTLATEEAEAGQAQSRELRSRVEELERQIDTMKRLLELKDDTLAQMQSGAGQEPLSGAAAGEPDISEPAPMAADEKSPGIMGKLMDNPLLAGAGVLVAILLGGFLWAANRQKSQAGMFDDDLNLGDRLDREAFDDVPQDTPSINIQEHSWDDAQEQPEHAGEHDALTEADVYLAYGRIQQAEEVLQAALQDDPGNDAYRLKLLEVYHAAGNVAAFEQAASDYRDSVTVDDSRWLKVAEMGKALAPGNELFVSDADSGADFDMDLSGMDHLPETGENNGNLPDSVEFGMDDAGADEEDLQEGVLASEDEVTTKLDLARAYIDMDDQESARSILGEVIHEGNAGQKQEAEKIIARLA